MVSRYSKVWPWQLFEKHAKQKFKMQKKKTDQMTKTKRKQSDVEKTTNEFQIC